MEKRRHDGVPPAGRRPREHICLDGLDAYVVLVRQVLRFVQPVAA